LKFDPGIGEIYRHIGDVHEKLKQCDPLVKAYQLYLELTPDATDKTYIQDKIKQCKRTAINEH